MAVIHRDGGEKIKSDKTGCDWKGCKGEPHPVRIKPKYPDRKKGVIDKKPIPNDVHPNLLYGDLCGKNVLGHTFPYRTTKMKSKWYYNYRFQRHHIIPANMRKKFKKLFFNLKLMGWDLNSPISNCLNLPMYDKDIVWHDLQTHRGSHPRYDGMVKVELLDLETECLDFCKNSETGDKNLPTQDNLIPNTSETTSFFAEMILNWNPAWILVSTSLASRNSVFSSLSDDKQGIPVYQTRKLEIK